MHAGEEAFAHRRQKKRDFRRLWQTRIGAAAQQLGTSYSKLMHALKEQNIALDRKTLAHLAKEKPETFQRVVKKVQ